MICSAPTNHVRDLDVSPTNHVRNLNMSLNNINEQPNSANTITSPPAADRNTNTNLETPRQEPPQTCTRTSLRLQQGYMFCITPTNHVHNLDMALNSSNASLINHIRNSDVDLNNLPTD